MRLLTVTLSIVLSLFGCDDSPTLTSTVRDSAGSTDRLHSQVRVTDGKGRFACLASASGRCHYAVFDAACDSAARGCTPAHTTRFSIGAGESVVRTGLPRHPRVCVDGAHAPAECQPG